MPYSLKLKVKASLTRRLEPNLGLALAERIWEEKGHNRDTLCTSKAGHSCPIVLLHVPQGLVFLSPEHDLSAEAAL